MIGEIFLSKEKYPGYNFLKAEYGLQNLGKINVFIGQNNSGKSRFLRTLFTDEEFEFQLRNHNFSKIVSLINEKHSEVKNILQSNGYAEIDQIFTSIDTAHKQIGNFKLGNVKVNIKKVSDLADYYARINNFGGASHLPNVIATGNPERIFPAINKIGLEIKQALSDNFPKDFGYEVEKIYIPILKGLRPIQMNKDNEFGEQKDNYKSRTLRDYFTDLDQKKISSEIFTGLSLYEDTKKLLLGDRHGREKIKKFEEFLKNSFFDGQEITLIPDINNDVLLIGIGNEERPVYALGDGIQAIIILLYPLFFNQDKNLLVFIEEPENSLHPGMQRLFLETLMKDEFRNFQFFISTHSNHFLDITLDLENISIYTFNKKNDSESNAFSCVIENTSNDDIKILELIGARNASVFLSNCTIWVEGITDRLYLKKYLEIYQRHLIEKGKLKVAFREDFNFSFIEYGGGNIVHWSFTNELGWDKIQANRISSKIFIVVDKDNSEDKPTSSKGLRLAQLKKKLGKRFEIVNGREIENTLSEKVIIQVIKKLEAKNALNVEYDNKKLKFDKYQNQKLGKFIASNFKNLKRKYEADSGTIYCKLEFCKTSLDSMNSIDDLSEEALRLTQNIFSFISESNK